MHKPALVAALVAANDGMWGKSRGDVKTRRVLWQIAVKIPANPNVTKFKRSGEAAAHVRKI